MVRLVANRFLTRCTRQYNAVGVLNHAFEQFEAIVVGFRTHWHNQASRRAIERLGAKQDGVLRNHWKMPDGGYRETVVFSIINSEWPTVKMALEHKLN